MFGRFLDTRTGLAMGSADVPLTGVVSSLSQPQVVYVPETAATAAHYLVGVVSSGTLTGVIAGPVTRTFGAPFSMLTVPTGSTVDLTYSPCSASIVAVLQISTGTLLVQEFDSAGTTRPNGQDTIVDNSMLGSTAFLRLAAAATRRPEFLVLYVNGSSRVMSTAIAVLT